MRFTFALLFGLLNANISDVATEAVQILTEEFPNIQTKKEAAIVSIAGPELVRFQQTQNLIETSILELSYVQYGSDFLDFSVGLFQMKPSFVEKLEEKISCSASLQDWISLSQYDSEEFLVIRQERLNRISNPQQAQKYLAAFYAYCEERYADTISTFSIQQKVNFIGTAYNLGMDLTASEIMDYQTNKYFPYGKEYEGSQFAYGELSAAIFHQLTKQTCTATN